MKPSQRKRERKRKRKEAVKANPETLTPPSPEIGAFVDIGLSIVTRNLQNGTPVATESTDAGQKAGLVAANKTSIPPSAPYSAIFVARSGQPNVLNSHLPQMVAGASQKDAFEDSTRLVGFSKACQDRLSETLGIPRVSVIGLRRDAPNAKALVAFIQRHVSIVEAAWMKESREFSFKATKINTIETIIGSKRQKGK